MEITKHYCDRCGQELKGLISGVSVVAVFKRFVILKAKKLDSRTETKELCKNCFEKIIKFMEPTEPI